MLTSKERFGLDRFLFARQSVRTFGTSRTCYIFPFIFRFVPTVLGQYIFSIGLQWNGRILP